MQGKKPTRKQRNILEQAKLNTSEWLIIKDIRHSNGKIIIQNRETKELKEICLWEEP